MMKRSIVLLMLLSTCFYAVAGKLDKRLSAAPIFDKAYYLANNSDVASTGTDPLKHWQDVGLGQGRPSSPVFDVKYYLNRYVDLNKRFGTDYVKAAMHYLDFGIKEGRQASANFDPKFYVENNPDLAKRFGGDYSKAIDHFLKFGINENRRTANNDRDDDGVANENDKCPDEAGAPSNNGCPVATKLTGIAAKIMKQMDAKLAEVAKNINFESGKATLTPETFKVLDAFYDFMKDYPTVRFSISGHTDNAGKPEANLKLSQMRANVVKDYLVRKGMERFRMDAKGFGDTQPIGDNATPEGKAKNRRTEMKMIP